ncbi:hypothetical protein ACTFIW_008765 [Dictyostelium discoideum]
MERAFKPMHTLRLLHYFSDARATAHYDTREILSNGNVRAIRHILRCNERYAVVYFHNSPKEYALSSQKYRPSTMAHVYQEAQLWYVDVNARAVRKVCSSAELSWYAVLYGWLAQRWTSVNESHISQKEEPAGGTVECKNRKKAYSKTSEGFWAEFALEKSIAFPKELKKLFKRLLCNLWELLRICTL